MQIKVALTGTNSRPFLLDGFKPVEAADALEDRFAELEKLVQKQVSPQRTSTVAAHFRRLGVSALARRLASRLLSELEAR